MGRTKWKAQREKRDGQQFVALPLVVLQSPGYRAASHVARSLLLDIAAQHTGRNNGALVACAKYLQPLGWRSNDTIVRARRELLELGLLLETRKGARPNRAAWYALTWQALDVTDGLDINPKLYRTGAYREAPEQSASLVPSGGAGGTRIAPSGGARPSSPAPCGSAIRPLLTPSPAPSGGACLEAPSAPASGRGLAVRVVTDRHPALQARARRDGL
jgi:hypothetical protein